MVIVIVIAIVALVVVVVVIVSLVQLDPLPTRRKGSGNTNILKLFCKNAITPWSSLMQEVLESRGLPLDDAFPDLHKSVKMCKNSFKVYDSLSKKCTKLKKRLVVIVRRTCDQSEQ